MNSNLSGNSMITAEYQKSWRPDEFVDAMAHFVREADGKVSRYLLESLAVTNGVWDSRYIRLNVGHAAMVIFNRLRAKDRRGEAIKAPQPLDRRWF